MLVFENERSQAIVERLVKSAGAVRLVVILYFTVVLAVLTGVLFYLVNPSSVLWFVTGVAGGFLGLMIGMLVSSVISVILEWMAQVLIAQGEILARLKESK